MKKLRIGYMALSKASWATDAIENVRASAVKSLAEQPFHIVHEDSLTVTPEEAKKLCSEFTKKEVDAVILHFVTFPVGAMIPAIAQKINVPLILFATPEKPMENKVWAQNSFCGANMAVHTLRKLGRKYEFVFGEAQNAGELMKTPLSVIGCAKTLASAKVGLVGGRVPGFYTSNCDELRLRSSFGTEVELIDLLEIVDVANGLAEGEANEGIEAVRKSASCIARDVESDVAPAGRMFGAFMKTADKYNLSSYAIRCWPEWSDIYGIAPCSIIGILNDRGLITSCEGDVLGAVLMSAQSCLAECSSFFADLISFDKDTDSAVFWHCGAAPVSLCRKFEDTQMRRHFRVDGGDKKGIVNEFPVKSGTVTIAQLDEDGDCYRMLIAKGKAVETAQIIRGNPLDIHFGFPVERLIDAIMTGGFKHHYSLVHKDITGELLSLCRWYGIQPVIIQ